MNTQELETRRRELEAEKVSLQLKIDKLKAELEPLEQRSSDIYIELIAITSAKLGIVKGLPVLITSDFISRRHYNDKQRSGVENQIARVIRMFGEDSIELQLQDRWYVDVGQEEFWELRNAYLERYPEEIIE